MEGGLYRVVRKAISFKVHMVIYAIAISISTGSVTHVRRRQQQSHSRKPHPSQREEGSGHAATIELSPRQKLDVTNQIRALRRSHQTLPLSAKGVACKTRAFACDVITFEITKENRNQPPFWCTTR